MIYKIQRSAEGFRVGFMVNGELEFITGWNEFRDPEPRIFPTKAKAKARIRAIETRRRELRDRTAVTWRTVEDVDGDTITDDILTP
jgi:hypothetical protein